MYMVISYVFCLNFCFYVDSGADLDQLIRQAGRNRIKHLRKEGAMSERAIFKADIDDALNLLVKARHHTRVLKINKKQKTVKSSKS